MARGSRAALLSLVLVLLSYDLAECSCPSGWSFNFSVDACVHPILGDPPSPAAYCEGLNPEATVVTSNGVQLCSLSAGSRDGGTGSGGLPIGKR